jgi:citrate synthase
MPIHSPIARGLAGVVADTTAICDIDGARGQLRYRGYPIEELASRPFIEVVGLVLDGERPDGAGQAELATALARHRALPPAVEALLAQLPRDTHPMTMLQVALPLCDGPADKTAPVLGSRAAQRQRLLGLAAKVPTLIASWFRLRQGLAPVPPDAALPLHADFLRMLHDRAPLPREVEVLDVTQILQLEHGFNASTFTGRVVASTLCPLSMTLSACVAALYGPLHGGADEAAYRMALEIGQAGRAAAWVDAKLAAGEKIMGLGHREYRVVDPRATVLKGLALELAELKGLGEVVRVLQAVDDHAAARFAEKGKAIRANVEFYKGAVFASLGLPPDLFTSLFVMARVFGWGAHVLELWDDHQLYRPAAAYIGPSARSIA